MNVYEEAHNLARSIKESNEFIEFDEARRSIESDPELRDMISEFQKAQIRMQTRMMNGEQTGNDLMQQVQSMYIMLQGKPEAVKYIERQARFSIMMKDVYEILSDAIGIKAEDFGL